MIIVGKYATEMARPWTYAEMQAFSNECSKLRRMPIVDVAWVHDCPSTMRIYILMARNCLHVHSMDHNFIPLFIVWEVGLTANEVPRICCSDE